MEERRAVIQGLLEADCIPAGMELFPASDNEKWDLIRGVIDDCDYYLLIIGGRYGSVDPASALSYTEMEYDYAVGTGKPVMAFLHGKPGEISVEKSDIDPLLRQKLLEFRQKAEQRMVKYWTSTNDLDGAVAKSLIKLRKTHPAEGWIRARHAMTPEVERDFAELRAKVSELTQQLESAKSASKFNAPEGLADGDDKYQLGFEFVYWRDEDRSASSYNRPKWTDNISVDVTWNEIFFDLGPTLLDEASEESIGEELRDLAIATLSDNRHLLPDGYGGMDRATIYSDSIKDVVVQLFALGLIERGVKKRPINNSEKYWVLTEPGRDRLMKLRAIRRDKS